MRTEKEIRDKIKELEGQIEKCQFFGLGMKRSSHLFRAEKEETLDRQIIRIIDTIWSTAGHHGPSHVGEAVLALLVCSRIESLRWMLGEKEDIRG